MKQEKALSADVKQETSAAVEALGRGKSIVGGDDVQLVEILRSQIVRDNGSIVATLELEIAMACRANLFCQMVNVFENRHFRKTPITGCLPLQYTFHHYKNIHCMS